MRENAMFIKDEAQAYEECVEATAHFIHKNGFSDVVIGLSGGLDSSLVAAIACDAIGASHVHGVLLPGPFTSERSLEDALMLARGLEMETHTVSIVQAYDDFCVAFEDACGEPLVGIASENVQARCRMIVLMSFSNQFGWLMLNTGNRSEAAMGYSTLYGDTAGAFAPLGGLYKTEVIRLAEWRNAQAKSAGDDPVIPLSILAKPPSAELSADQTDEASMGIEYVVLDAILDALSEENFDTMAPALKRFDPQQLKMVSDRYHANAFKRAVEPPLAAVSR